MERRTCAPNCPSGNGASPQTAQETIKHMRRSNNIANYVDFQDCDQVTKLPASQNDITQIELDNIKCPPQLSRTSNVFNIVFFWHSLFQQYTGDKHFHFQIFPTNPTKYEHINPRLRNRKCCFDRTFSRDFNGGRLRLHKSSYLKCSRWANF